MATSGSVDSGGYQGRVLRFNWDTQSVNIANNTRTIIYSVTAVGGSSSYYYHHNETIEINGTRVYTGSDSHQVYTNDVLVSNTITINQNDTQTLSVKMHGGIYSRTDNINKEQSWTLDAIPRYAQITSHSVVSTGMNSITVSWSADSNCDAVQYSLNGGNWTDTNGRTYSISGLSPNTSYRIKTRVRRADSQLWTESSEISGTTKDIAKISNVNNFNHGDSIVVNITNPSGSSLSLAMKIGNTQIQSKSVSAGNNTISFSDTELDNIYKLYGRENTLTATFVLTTAGTYTNSKTCTVTLKGNQKTVKTNINGSWKRGKVWVNINGTWKKAVIWTNVNGTWRRCI